MVTTLEYDIKLNFIRLYIFYDNAASLNLRIAAVESVEIDFGKSSMCNMPFGSGYYRFFWTSQSTLYLKLMFNG